MPNHVSNEVVFDGISEAQAEMILDLVRNQKGDIDFSILLPIPLNCWMGSVGAEHKKVFPNNALEWCTANWSTKWDAYGKQSVTYEDRCLALRFQTAWRAPYGWMCALFNKGGIGFRYGYFSEGELRAHVGTFTYIDSPWSSQEWGERLADPQEEDHLGLLRWGAAWEEIKAERTEAES